MIGNKQENDQSRDPRRRPTLVFPFPKRLLIFLWAHRGKGGRERELLLIYPFKAHCYWENNTNTVFTFTRVTLLCQRGGKQEGRERGREG